MSTENKFLRFEAVDLLSCTTTMGTLYGIVFVLYCLCARPLYLKLGEPDKKHRARFSLGYISVVFFCATIVLAVNARVIQLAYINHANFPGGPLAYEISNPTTYPVIGSAFALVGSSLTMGIQIQRLWIVWSGTRYAITTIILPVLLLLSFIAMETLNDLLPASVRLRLSSSILLKTYVATFAIMSGFTALVTGLIAVRILRVRQQQKKIMSEMSEDASPYLSIVAMLVESYILESAWSFASAISVTSSSPSELVFATNDSMIKAIAYFLVIYRVETGRGWTKQTEAKLTSLQWNHGPTTSDNQSQVPVTTTIMTAPILNP